MRGLLKRILLSPEHENTGLESVRVIKAPHLILKSINQTMGKKENSQDKPDHSQTELGTPSHSKIQIAQNSKPQQNTNGLEIQATTKYK
jgi:hypothetical protein